MSQNTAAPLGLINTQNNAWSAPDQQTATKLTYTEKSFGALELMLHL